MTKRKPITAKRAAIRIHSQLVRNRGVCQRCGKTETDGVQLSCSHLITRTATATATLLANAFCHCAGCHWYLTKWPLEYAAWIEQIDYTSTYRRLKKMAVRHTRERARFDWFAEEARLKTLAELGVVWPPEMAPPTPAAWVLSLTVISDNRDQVTREGML